MEREAGRGLKPVVAGGATAEPGADHVGTCADRTILEGITGGDAVAEANEPVVTVAGEEALSKAAIWSGGETFFFRRASGGETFGRAATGSGGETFGRTAAGGGGETFRCAIGGGTLAGLFLLGEAGW